jgi:hypothetical protein
MTVRACSQYLHAFLLIQEGIVNTLSEKVSIALMTATICSVLLIIGIHLHIDSKLRRSFHLVRWIRPLEPSETED